MQAVRATRNDARDIFRLLMEMYEDVGMAGLSGVKVANTINTLLDNGAIFIVRDAKDELVGSIGVNRQSFWYSEDDHFADYWTYVRKNARKSRAIFLLLNAVRDHARCQGLPLFMGVLTPKDAERKNRLFRRYMTPVGELFAEGI